MQERPCSSTQMFFRPRKNRRRVDLAKKTGEMKAVARAHAPLALRLVLSCAISAGLFWGSWEGWRWANTTPRLALRELSITGNQRATEAELARLGGLNAGVNLVAMDLAAVERAIAAHPWVREVRVQRQLPSRVLVNVVEREPVALVSLGDLYLVDVAGEPFKRLQVGDGVDLPMVTGLEREDFVQHREETVDRLAAAVEVVRAYSRSRVAEGHALSEVHLEAEGVTLVTEAGEEIRLGEGPLPEQLDRLATVRAALGDRALVAQVIRLDDRARPARVTVQLKPQLPERGARAPK